MADWKDLVRRSGPLLEVSIDHGTNGWASPPADHFMVRGHHYFSKKHKSPSGECLLQPLGMDWLKSHTSKFDHILSRPCNRIMQALRSAQTGPNPPPKAFIMAVNLLIPGRDHYSAVFYYFTEDPIPHDSLLHRFIHGDDAFRNSRFKLISRIVKGPWIVKATVGNHAACLLGKALTINYIRGPDYLELDVDIGSSTLASAILHLALGYVNSVTVDMAFLIEAQAEEELPERVLGTVRVAQIEMEQAELIIDPVEAHHHHAATHHVSETSWRGKFTRSISLLGHAGKPAKVEIEQEGIHANFGRH